MKTSSDRPSWRLRACAGLALAAALGAPALAQSFVGDWKATAHAQGVEAPETVHVMKAGDGYMITAKLIGAAPGTPEAGPGEDIVIDGDKFSYHRSVATANGPLQITYSGVVTGDSFAGQVELLGGKIPYTGERIRSGQ